MQTFTAVIERCRRTGLYVGYVPGFPGMQSQGETIEELCANLKEVITLQLKDGTQPCQADFIGTQPIVIA